MPRATLRSSKLKRELQVEEAELIEESLCWEYPEKGSKRVAEGAVTPRSTVLKVDHQLTLQGTTARGQTMRDTSSSMLDPTVIHGISQKVMTVGDLAVLKTTNDGSLRASTLASPTDLLQRLQIGKERRQQRRLANSDSPISFITDKYGNQRRRSQTVASTLQQILPTQKRHRLYTQSDDITTTQATSSDLELNFQTLSPPYPGFGAQGLAWTYATGTDADEHLMAAGVWLWHKPRTYFLKAVLVHADEPRQNGHGKFSSGNVVCPKEYRPREGCQDRNTQLVQVPVVIETNTLEARNEPTIVSHVAGLVLIKPHFPPWPDVRADPSHPDFLPQSKLAAYQASEIAGYRIWRYDRDIYRCSLRGCHNPAGEFSPNTRVCIGCGPSSIIRYCCHSHEMEAFPDHWRDCGKSRFVAKKITDHSTSPLYFRTMCPAIKAMKGRNSFDLHRQRHFTCHSLGHYTLFMPEPTLWATLTWPQHDPSSREMDFRIERLLNIAFLDPNESDIVQYLYRLLRHLVSISQLNREEHLQALESQFAAEFGKAIYENTDAEAMFPCDCVWYGSKHDPEAHPQTCTASALSHGGQQAGLLEKVSGLEQRYWILRAWAQQHPQVTDWQMRARGEGYGLKEEDIRLGPGFTGWGARPSNMFG